MTGGSLHALRAFEPRRRLAEAVELHAHPVQDRQVHVLYVHAAAVEALGEIGDLRALVPLGEMAASSSHWGCCELSSTLEKLKHI